MVGQEQLASTTKERVKGPQGRRLPSKKAGARKEGEDEEEVLPAIREFRTAARLVREEREQTAREEAAASEACRQGTVDLADFDRAWFLRVPSFSYQARKRRKSQMLEARCENNNKRTSTNSSEGEGEVEKVEEDKEEELCSVDSSGKGNKKNRWRFWRSKDSNCIIL